MFSDQFNEDIKGNFMTDDIIDEELQIAKEQDDQGDKVLNSKMFELPISELGLPKAICLEEDIVLLML